jgi:diaminopimelate epimerase
MLYWNADGSRAEMCGNGARCIVRLAYERGEAGSPLQLDTDAGPRRAAVVLRDGRVAAVAVDLGPPAWTPAEIPVRSVASVVEAPVQVGGVRLPVTALSMGNPHAIVFVDDPAALAATPLDTLGRELATHASFPHGANASFVAVSGTALHVRTWERGSGPTLACGTATCAAFAAAQRTGRLAGSRAVVHLPGGSVEVERSDDGHLWLRGPAEYVAEGTLAPELLARRPTDQVV